MSEFLFPDSASASNASPWWVAHCDGGSRGNPGPSGFGAVVEDPQGRIAARLSEFLGIQTNNFAEYSGLLAVLKWAIENGAKRLRVVSDSELMVKQMKGQYAVKSPVLRPLFEEARRLSRRLEAFEIRHTLRAGNKLADELANQAMDRGMGKSRDEGPGTKDQGPGTGSQSGLRAPAARPYGKLETTPRHSSPPARPVQNEKKILEGYVKNGVVHLLNGELPDGVFVKILYES
jgi:probable phosphoglycerate mutase